MPFASSLRDVLGTTVGGVRSGLGNWPKLTATLTVTTALVATAGAMETIWPKPASAPIKEQVPQDGPPMADNGSGGPKLTSFGGGTSTTTPGSLPGGGSRYGGNNVIGGSGSGSSGTGSGGGRNAGLTSAAYHPSQTPSRDEDNSPYQPRRSRAASMSWGDYRGAVADGQIRVGSLEEYERVVLPYEESPAMRKAMDQELRQRFEDAARAGGTMLEFNGTHGVVVGGEVASRFGYMAPSSQTMQAIANNRSMQAAQQRWGSQAHTYNAPRYQVANGGNRGGSHGGRR